MSLETLLEAAEFLESREQGPDIKGYRQLGFERQLSEPGTSSSTESNESYGSRTGSDGGRVRTKSGSQKTNIDASLAQLELPMTHVGDGVFMRSGTREVHNKLEKNRRAHLKECFDFLKRNIPSLEEKRTSNLGILRSSLRYIQNLKRKEREFETEMHQFVHQKIVLQERIASLKGDLNKMDIDVDIQALTVSHDHDNDTNSTSTATERGTPPPSDHDENDDDEEEAEILALETNSPTPPTANKKRKLHINKIPETLPPPPPHISSELKLPPKKAVLQSMNGLVKFTHPKVIATSSLSKPPPVAMGNSAPPLASSPADGIKNVANVSKMPVYPIAVTMSGQVNSQGITMLTPLSHSTTVDIGAMAGTKLVEIHKPRTPVTQILHQTLTQRQALQKQAAAAASSQVSAAPLTAAQLKSPPLSQPSALLTMTTPPGSLNSLVVKDGAMVVKDGVVAVRKPTPGSLATTSLIPQQKLPNAPVPTNARPTMTFPYYLGQVQKFSHPVLVTSLMAPAIGVQAATGMSVGVAKTTAPIQASVAHLNTAQAPVNIVKTNEAQTLLGQPAKQSVIFNSSVLKPAMQNDSNLVSLSVPSTAAVKTVPPPSLPGGVTGVPGISPVTIATAPGTLPIRQVFAPNLLPGQLTWPFLTVPRSPVIVPSSLQNSPSLIPTATIATTTSQLTPHPLVSLANLNQLTQMMTPMTVMSPGIQVAPTALSQAQLNGVFGAPLLKQLQLPLGLQTSLLQSPQVLGQQVVKPVVVVSVPSVATTTMTLPSNTTLVTSSSL